MALRPHLTPVPLLSDSFFDSLALFIFSLGEGAAPPGRQLDRWVFVGATKLPGLVRYRAAGRALLKRRLSI